MNIESILETIIAMIPIFLFAGLFAIIFFIPIVPFQDG